MDNNILVIGIAGGSASGKTTLMKNLIADFEDEVTVLSHDNYYKRHDELSYEERSRRIKRDVNKRGRSLESVLNQYQETVKPMHERYVEPSKKFAHLVVPEGGKNMVALDMIVSRIRRHLKEDYFGQPDL